MRAEDRRNDRRTVAGEDTIVEKGAAAGENAVAGEDAVRRERTLDASPAEVWETLTDEILLAQWLAADVELDPREGGDARFEFSDGETREASVDTVEPEERLAWTWREGGEATGRVELRLEPAVAGRTRLIVIESRPAASEVNLTTDPVANTAPVGRSAGVSWAPALASLAAMHSGLVCA